MKWLPAPVAEWYGNLARRERRMVLAGAAALAVLVVYLGVVQPVLSAHARLQNQVRQRRELLAYIDSAAPRLRAVGGKSRPAPGSGGDRSAFATVSAAAQKSPISDSVQRLEQTSDGGVRMSLSGASFDALMQWLGTLANEDGITVEQANVKRASDPGTVDGTLTLKGG